MAQYDTDYMKISKLFSVLHDKDMDSRVRIVAKEVLVEAVTNYDIDKNTNKEK